MGDDDDSVVCCESATHRLTLLPGHLLDKGWPPVGRSAKYGSEQHWHYAATAPGATCNNPSRQFVPQVRVAKGTNNKGEERNRSNKPVPVKIRSVSASHLKFVKKALLHALHTYKCCRHYKIKQRYLKKKNKLHTLEDAPVGSNAIERGKTAASYICRRAGLKLSITLK